MRSDLESELSAGVSDADAGLRKVEKAVREASGLKDSLSGKLSDKLTLLSKGITTAESGLADTAKDQTLEQEAAVKRLRAKITDATDSVTSSDDKIIAGLKKTAKDTLISATHAGDYGDLTSTVENFGKLVQKRGTFLFAQRRFEGIQKDEKIENSKMLPAGMRKPTVVFCLG